jgi:hypothetical protein
MEGNLRKLLKGHPMNVGVVERDLVKERIPLELAESYTVDLLRPKSSTRVIAVQPSGRLASNCERDVSELMSNSRSK